jgi:hypothetical protein
MESDYDQSSYTMAFLSSRFNPPEVRLRLPLVQHQRFVCVAVSIRLRSDYDKFKACLTEGPTLFQSPMGPITIGFCWKNNRVPWWFQSAVNSITTGGNPDDLAGYALFQSAIGPITMRNQELRVL